MEEAVGFHKSGRLNDAERIYLRLMHTNPALQHPRHMLGVLRSQQGRHSEALDLITAVLRETPRDPLAQTNYGNVLLELGRCEEALRRFEMALGIEPRFLMALQNRGSVLVRLDKFDEALGSFRKVLSIQEDFVPALIGQGDVLRKQGKLDEAIASYDKALLVDPNNFVAHFVRANILQDCFRYEEALENYDRTLAINPQHADAANNRGWSLLNLRRPKEAIEGFRCATAINPQLAGAYLNQGLCHMLLGDLKTGLPLYEWRKKLAEPIALRLYSQPAWTGAQDIEGKILFVYVEQGFGDCIQFYRYLTQATERGARIILAAPEAVTRLLSRAHHKVEIIGWNESPKDFDYHISLMSLPLALGTDQNSIPVTESYLTAEPDVVQRWASRIGRFGFKIGITWHGKDGNKGIEEKSFPVRHFVDIAKMPGVRLISLQKGESLKQLEHLPPTMTVETFENFDEGPDAFIDSAAIMKSLDLVITADNAVAHLAGALGVPTWVALKHVPDWRWFLDSANTPWYPNMRLFRQNKRGDWSGVFADIQDQLQKLSIELVA
jgi:tetratricopeptide (TPR) repeat protein